MPGDQLLAVDRPALASNFPACIDLLGATTFLDQERLGQDLCAYREPSSTPF